ncbi:metallophosphoesterase [Sphingopyxis sp.]|uniref:metallophosphoesterase n=1 Tax=Sphingopyxis sp. TaxID=1908224 RepID=UPI00344D2037
MFWKRKAKQVESAGRGFSVPAGQRVYAIGDIHGRDDLFAQMIDLIRADHAARAPAELTLVLLGDLVDRGPQSSQVVERAIQLRAKFPGLRFLIGNHEECFLAALTGNVRRLRYFMRIGGDATVQSYWPEGENFADSSFEEVAERLPGLVPQSHIDFMSNGEDMVEIGDYLFVHAGIRPGVPLEKQTIADLRWIAKIFSIISVTMERWSFTGTAYRLAPTNS